jgi:chromosome segregation ATPase
MERLECENAHLMHLFEASQEALKQETCLSFRNQVAELEAQRDDLLTENERAVQEINNWKARAEFSYEQRSNLEKQRDELLAALEGAANYIDRLSGDGSGYRIAIASVRGAA